MPSTEVPVILLPDLHHLQASTFCFLQCQYQGLSNIVIVGDFNFHMDLSDRSSAHFLGLLESHNLCQHVTEKTHKHGHILDLAITLADANQVSDVLVEDPGISDHSAVTFCMYGHRPPQPKKQIIYRAYRNININQLETIGARHQPC